MKCSRVQDRLDAGVRRRHATAFRARASGPTFGETVARSAIYAIIFSLLAIMAYVAFRFEPKFAVPVLIALFHDLLITAGVYSLSGREVTTSTVAALLTILGFSLYDTVIVFDRIRENAPRMPRATFSQIVNRSMSEVLIRSLATSSSTLFPVAALLLFGGETLKDFAFALLVGIASGTYSSIFIASPVLTAWKEREPAYVQRRRRIIEDFGMVPAYPVTTDGGRARARARRQASVRRSAAAQPAQGRRAAGAGRDRRAADEHGRDRRRARGSEHAEDGARDGPASRRPAPVGLRARRGPHRPAARPSAPRARSERAQQQRKRKHGRAR